MTVKVTFSCGGCDAEASGTTYLRQEIEQVSRNFARRLPVDIQSVAPEGWVAFDPYTGCCYCPECWDEIVAPAAKESK